MSALMGSLQVVMFFDRGTFGVLPLTYFYIPKSARAYLFPQSVKIRYFAAAPSVSAPFVRNQELPRTRAMSDVLSTAMQRGDPTWHLPVVAANVRHLVNFAHASNTKASAAAITEAWDLQPYTIG